MNQITSNYTKYKQKLTNYKLHTKYSPVLVNMVVINQIKFHDSDNSRYLLLLMTIATAELCSSNVKSHIERKRKNVNTSFLFFPPMRNSKRIYADRK